MTAEEFEDCVPAEDGIKTSALTRLLDIAEPSLGPHHFSYWDFEGAADAAEEAKRGHRSYFFAFVVVVFLTSTPNFCSRRDMITHRRLSCPRLSRRRAPKGSAFSRLPGPQRREFKRGIPAYDVLGLWFRDAEPETEDII
jgi:hypothetical protein